MRILVTGNRGQVATSLLERAAGTDIEIIALGRPRLDLADREGVLSACERLAFDAIINAAAYTAVDKAETDERTAMLVNAQGAAHVAEAAARKAVPLLHLSTDYVFDGSSDRPYVETDITGPTSVYGRSKLAGEQMLARIHADHAIFRTGWVYSPFGSNFVRTMLRLGETRDEISVVADQFGNPTSALDIADALLRAARLLVPDSSTSLRGIFHMTGGGETSWAGLAEATFAAAARNGSAPVRVRRISSAEYPTQARRPHNSRLDNSKIHGVYDITLPSWESSLRNCVDRLAPGRRSVL